MKSPSKSKVKNEKESSIQKFFKFFYLWFLFFSFKFLLMKIYLDNAATTALDPKVEKAMIKAHRSFGNPSSLHSFGQEAKTLLDQSRITVAEFLNCNPTEVIFTSGGSESDNLAIRGIIASWEQGARSREKETPNSKLQTPHVITTAIEHHAVLHTIEDLEKEGKIEATYIKPGTNGIIKVADVEAAIKPNTVLVSIMYVNNETGCMQPIREIGKLIERVNRSRTSNSELRTSENKSSIYFHTDAVQAAEYLNMDTKYLHVDLLTMTAHKIHGPKGVGVLFVKKGIPILAQIAGGDQEFRLRAGTENTAAISGLAAAIAEVKSQKSKVKTIEGLRNKLEDFILKNIPNTYLNGDKEKRAPHITNISFKNAEGEAIILNLDFLGIAVSSGSACTARSLEPSHVLTAMDVPHELSHGAIRFSLSRYTTEEEVDKVCEALPGIISKLRQMSPFG